MNKIRNMICLIVLLSFLIPSVSALQQTSGAINFSVEPGKTVTEKYGIRNDDSNNSISIKFNISNEISEFITYEKIMTLSPNEFRYVNITANVPSDYSGNKTIKGIIYVLKEGDKSGQVQLNIRLGKYININVEDRNVPEEIPKNNDIKKADNFLPAIMFIGIIFTVYVMIRKK